jgi:ribokinase
MHARQIGAITIFNPSPLPTLAQLREFPWVHLEWLIINEGEVSDLLKAMGEYPQSTGDADPVAAARELVTRLHTSKYFSPTLSVICTLGSLGLLALISERTKEERFEIVHMPAAKLDGEVRDTTGAGDCFTGYFVAGLMEEGSSASPDHSRTRTGIIRALQRATEVSRLMHVLYVPDML